MTELRVGSINGSHGVRGWVKVFSYTDPVAAILDYGPWTLRKGSKVEQVEVLDGQMSGRKLIARLDGVTDRNTADTLNGYDIYVSKGALPALAEGDYYWYQLEGIRVVNRQGETLGVIERLFETGANDVMVVQASPDSIDDTERLIPYVEDEVIEEIDLSARVMTVNWQSDY